jgi:hypothetical protein
MLQKWEQRGKIFFYRFYRPIFYFLWGDIWIQIFYFFEIKVFVAGCRKKILNRRIGCDNTDENGNVRRYDRGGDKYSTFSSWLIQNDTCQRDTDNRVREENRNLENFSVSFILLANNLESGFVRMIKQRHVLLGPLRCVLPRPQSRDKLSRSSQTDKVRKAVLQEVQIYCEILSTLLGFIFMADTNIVVKLVSLQL